MGVPSDQHLGGLLLEHAFALHSLRNALEIEGWAKGEAFRALTDELGYACTEVQVPPLWTGAPVLSDVAAVRLRPTNAAVAAPDAERLHPAHVD